jgi:hypothetical protein
MSHPTTVTTSSMSRSLTRHRLCMALSLTCCTWRQMKLLRDPTSSSLRQSASIYSRRTNVQSATSTEPWWVTSRFRSLLTNDALSSPCKRRLSTRSSRFVTRIKNSVTTTRSPSCLLAGSLPELWTLSRQISQGLRQWDCYVRNAE